MVQNILGFSVDSNASFILFTDDQSLIKMSSVSRCLNFRISYPSVLLSQISEINFLFFSGENHTTLLSFFSFTSEKSKHFFFLSFEYAFNGETFLTYPRAILSRKNYNFQLSKYVKDYSCETFSQTR